MGQGVEKVIMFVVCLFVQHLNVTDDERQKLQVSVTASLFNSAVCEFAHFKCTVCVCLSLQSALFVDSHRDCSWFSLAK